METLSTEILFKIIQHLQQNFIDSDRELNIYKSENSALKKKQVIDILKYSYLIHVNNYYSNNTFLEILLTDLFNWMNQIVPINSYITPKLTNIINRFSPELNITLTSLLTTDNTTTMNLLSTVLTLDELIEFKQYCITSRIIEIIEL